MSYRSLVVLSLVILNSACGVQSGGGAGTDLTAAGGSTHITSGGGAAHATADGTITSGGGNTLDGKMTERYSEDIQKLPEYVHFILPQLRRLSQDHADVLVAYLQWVAINKAWYFVPVQLPSLPKERIALAFQSDQLALHSEKEIFIDKKAYLAETEKERAFLLMHEMVMGAKLLMKKSPQKQCAILNGMLDPAVCSDPAVLKLAVSDVNDIDSKDPEAILNGRDHESVRAMTIFLMDTKQNLIGANVAAKRRQLDFNFPWDSVLSQVDQAQFLGALQRSTLAEEALRADGSFATPDATDCYLRAYETRDNWSLTFGTGKWESELSSSKTFKMHWEISNGSTLAVETHGVLDPSGSGQMVDLVEISPNATPSSYSVWNNERFLHFKMQFYISRGAQPHLIEYRAIPVALRERPVYRNGFRSDDVEAIEIKSLKPLRCQVQ